MTIAKKSSCILICALLLLALIGVIYKATHCHPPNEDLRACGPACEAPQM